MAKSILKSIQNEVLEIVETFNKKHETFFQITFRGSFAYLSKIEKFPTEDFRHMIAQNMGVPLKKMPKPQEEIIETKIGRLQYNGQTDNWVFAVFKYSREIYDPNEWIFPGSSKLNGTIRGALNAGLELY